MISPLMLVASIPGGWSIFHAPSVALQCIISSENPSTLNDGCWTLRAGLSAGAVRPLHGRLLFLRRSWFDCGMCGSRLFLP